MIAQSDHRLRNAVYASNQPQPVLTGSVDRDALWTLDCTDVSRTSELYKFRPLASACQYRSRDGACEFVTRKKKPKLQITLDNPFAGRARLLYHRDGTIQLMSIILLRIGKFILNYVA